MNKQKRKWIKQKPNSLRKIKKCEECGISETKAKLLVHHFRPKSMGGKNNRVNLMKVCGKCHKKLDFLALNNYEEDLIEDELNKVRNLK